MHGGVNGDGAWLLVNGQGVVVGLWCIEAEPLLGIIVRLEVGMASFIVIRHVLVMEGAVGFVAKVRVFK